MNPFLVICRGLPASGKTTFARTWVAEDTANRARVNKDDLRLLLHNGVYLGHESEDVVNMIRDSMIESLLRSGVSVVNDDTNLPEDLVEHLAKIGDSNGAIVLIKDLRDVPIDECLARDAARINGVGAKVIHRLAKSLPDA